MTQPTNNEIEVIPAGSLEAITRGEIDIQIATAHRFPRRMSDFKRRALEMATLDEETAASCIYSRPVGKGPDGKQKYAEGMSVRMAEIVGASYGNLRVGAMLIEQTERYVKARGYAHDLESNFASTSEVIESTVKKDGRPYDERMRIVIAKSCLAKARRDATFQVVPKALCKPVETEARLVAIGDATTLEKRRGAVLNWIGKLGIAMERVWAALGIKGEEDLGIDELTTLTGIKTAIKDGDSTVDECFPQSGAGEGGKPKFVPPKEETKTEAPSGGAETSSAGPEPSEPGELPRDPTELTKHVRDLCMRSDLDEPAVLALLKAKHKCGASCKTLADVARSGLVWAAENIGAIVTELDQVPA